MRASSRAFALSCTFAVGCIPSHRLVHEGDVYFERCYGADFAAEIGPQQKEACWQAWLAHYTKHQPAHRVDYALARIEALQDGQPTPALPGLVRGSLSGGEVREELVALDAAASYTGSSLLGPLPQDAGPVPNGCARFCEEYLQQCLAQCPRDSTRCGEGCDRERAVCLGGCH